MHCQDSGSTKEEGPARTADSCGALHEDALDLQPQPLVGRHRADVPPVLYISAQRSTHIRRQPSAMTHASLEADDLLKAAVTLARPSHRS
jgi:hypothetical protein